MKHTHGKLVRTSVIAALLALAAASPALAQGRGGGGPPGGGGPGGGLGGPGGGGMGNPPQFPNGGPGPMGPGPMGSPPQPSQRTQSTDNPPRPSLELAPPGRWWDDKSMIKNLKLRPEQQARMDAIFDQNRNALQSHLEAVQQAKAQMAVISKSPAPEESALFTQIDRVYQAQAELDKEYTHMLLQIRKEMDADQIKRLEKSTQR
jgi:Spy/CpxP family protein refolding chaperone